MQIYECIFSLITGVGVFIFAMKIMSDSLKEIAGDRMKTLLEKLAGNRIKGVLIGALVTAVIQSSSATTVMVIGFVNADVMTLNQAAAIIIGSNIGTTATGLLASLESLNISLYLSLLVFIGVMLSFIKKLVKIANLLTGLGLIFVGLKLMSNACNDDSIKDAFTDILQKINFPLLLEVLGIVFTAIIQSSSAMTGIVIVMVGNKVMGMDNGLFITLGSNVGTCITALIGIIGANTNSKRTAVIHLIFNICGCLLFTPILWIFKAQILDILNSIVSNQSMQIAYFHLFFNITTAIVTTPLINYLVKIAKFIIKDRRDSVIVETLEEKGSFTIRDSSTTDVNMDEISNNSRNFSEKNIIDINYNFENESNENKYEPPIILENYFNNNEEKKENKDKLNILDNQKIEIKYNNNIKDNINIDNEINNKNESNKEDSNDKKDKDDIIEIKEDNKKNNIENEEKNDDSRNIEKEEEKIDKKDENEEEEKLEKKEKIDKKYEDIEKVIKDDINEKEEDKIDKINIDKQKGYENLEVKNIDEEKNNNQIDKNK